MRLKPVGLVLTGAAILLPLGLLAGEFAKHDPIAIFSQYLGIAALIAMAISQIIATRLPGVEAVFGGLDRGYILHKWLGIGAMVAVLLHDTIDAEIRGLGPETVLVEAAETSGEISLYGILILLVITVATFVPYHLWLWTHRLMGAFFAMAAFHYVAINKPFGNLDPLGLYVGLFCLAGVLAYVWKLIPVQRGRRYRVEKIEALGRDQVVTLAPIGRPMRYRAGQFAFVRFEQDGLSEVHPFTVSKAPDPEGTLRFTIAALGDFTGRQLPTLEVGAEALVEGPFGRFRRLAGAKREIWIAAGVGITPFAAWVGDLDGNGPPVDLIYCVRTEGDAQHLDELRALAERLPNFTLHVHESARDGRLNTHAALALVGEDLAGAQAYFCGPQKMRESLAAGFAAKGLRPSRFHFEEFEIRTGIGLRRLSEVLLKRALAGPQVSKGI